MYSNRGTFQNVYVGPNLLEGDKSATGVHNRHQSDDRDVSETERIDSIIRDHTDKPLDETLDGTINPSNPTRTSNPATENCNVARIPNTRVRKRARGVSSSPNRTDKKTLVENGVVRETVKDIPNNVRKRFFKIRYVPGKLMTSKSLRPLLFVSQQAERKKTMLGRMTGDQAKHWRECRNSYLTAERLKGPCSWVDQAVEN